MNGKLTPTEKKVLKALQKGGWIQSTDTGRSRTAPTTYNVMAKDPDSWSGEKVLFKVRKSTLESMGEKDILFANKLQKAYKTPGNGYWDDQKTPAPKKKAAPPKRAPSKKKAPSKRKCKAVTVKAHTRKCPK